jgi:hypothetical protein
MGRIRSPGGVLALLLETFGFWIRRLRLVVEIGTLNQSPKSKSQQHMAEQNRKIVDHRNAALSGISPNPKSNCKIALTTHLPRYS